MQSQFLQSCGLSLQNRLAKPFNEADLNRLLHDERTLIRTWRQRNTVHVYAVADWPTVVSAMQVLSTYRERAAQLGLDEAEMLIAIDRVGEILAGRNRACRADFVEADPSRDLLTDPMALDLERTYGAVSSPMGSLAYGARTVATSGCSRSHARPGASARHVIRAAWPRSPPTSPITCCLTFLVRQWVLSLPKRLRPFLEGSPDIEVS